MLFNSSQFLIFFPVVTVLFFLLPKKFRTYQLLIASYYFYMCWNAGYALLLLFSTLVTYVSGLLLGRAAEKLPEDEAGKYKKLIVAGSFILNLAVLFYFKYTNFFFALINSLMARLHIQYSLPTLDILLPVGISFFTFQALSYTMDVYRGDIYPEKNFLKYALFVSFFPQLVAGPIERSKNLLKQLSEHADFDFDRARDGFFLMLWGYFLKIVMADRIAVFVDTVYGDIENHGGLYLVVASMLFALQIYCDFAGYSTIARGAARILGVELMENFRAPYLSCSVADFWRNWHISLTSWFRDYLYFPLGGSRKGRLRKYINKLIVFLVSGLWHGASVSFVIWGGLNGLFQVAGELLMPLRDRLIKFLGLHRESLGHRLVHIAGTFILVDFAWIFFRASTAREAIAVIKSIFTVYNPWILFNGGLLECGLDIWNFGLMLIGIGIILFSDICLVKGISIRERIFRQDGWFICVFTALAVAAILTFGIWGPGYNEAEFIYFQF